MKVKVNQKEFIVAPQSTLLTLLEQLNLPTQGIAIAIEQKILPRKTWSEYKLKENDTIDIIKAVCGG